MRVSLWFKGSALRLLSSVLQEIRRLPRLAESTGKGQMTRGNQHGVGLAV